MSTQPTGSNSWRREVTAHDLDRIDWVKGDGLVPAIVQHARDGGVLMLGYMNREALRTSFERGRVVFFSRSRDRLWEKGETSGNHLELRSVRTDCDADTLLIAALPAGPVCHTGTASCFGEATTFGASPTDGNSAPAGRPGLGFLPQLEQVIAQRIADNPEHSYTARLFHSGIKRMAQKIGEEGLEVALAACTEGDEALLGESADLLYHLLVLLRSRGLSFEQVGALLRTRHANAR